MAPLLLALAQLAPQLIKYIGAGDTTVGKVATAAAGIAVAVAGGPEGHTTESAIAKIAADPAKLAEFQIKVNEQAMEWDKMYLADIQSARERDTKLHEAGYQNSRANYMLASAYLIVIFIVLGIIVDATLNEYVKGVFTLVLGRMLGYIDQGFNFEFGTTRSSKTKDETISKLTGDGER